MNKQQIAHNIEAAREEKGITISELRRRIGIDGKPFSHSQYYRIKNGDQLPSLAVLVKLRRELGVSIDKLLEVE